MIVPSLARKNAPHCPCISNVLQTQSSDGDGVGYLSADHATYNSHPERAEWVTPALVPILSLQLKSTGIEIFQCKGIGYTETDT